MKSIIPCLAALSVIACSEAQSASPSPSPTPPTAQVMSAVGTPLSVGDLDAGLEALMSATGVPGVGFALINDGAIVYDQVYGVMSVESGAPITAATSFEAASLSKPLFAFLTMTFVEDGLLDLDRPLHEYLPNPDIAHDDRYLQITARHVLSHQSGLPNWRTDTPELGLHMKFAPGEGFFYSGEGFEYLADVLMYLAGTDDAGLEAIFQNRIADPLGMERSTFIDSDRVLSRLATPHRDGTPIAPDTPDYTFGAAYSLHSDAVDYARFLAGMIDGAILDPQTYDAMLAGQSTPIPADDPARAEGLADWALGFSIYQLPFGTFYTHGGNNPGYTSTMVVNPDTGWGVVVFTNADQASDFIQGALFMVSGLN
jgi:CubicO group peptidase (beta-lactamase class C family)